MLAKLRLPWRAVVPAAALLVITAACGGGDAGPTAAPQEVVGKAPDRTLARKTATVVSAAPGYEARGSVDFVTGEDRLEVARTSDKAPPFGVVEPVAALDLLRGVIDIEAYGGSQVQGSGTKRYQVDIDLEKAIAATPEQRRADLHSLDGRLGEDDEIWADVFVDKQGLVRRILLPVQADSYRPYGDDDRIPRMVSVDFSDFGGPE